MSLIFVLEDDPVLQMGIVDNLRLENYQVVACDTVAAFEQHLARTVPDLAVMDLGLPDGDGGTLLADLRRRGLRFPALLLTARASETDVLMGFKRGADDYVTKPFSPRILLARIAALLQRAAAPRETLLVFGELVVDPVNMLIRGDDAPHLSTLEYQVLAYLADNMGQAVSRVALLEEVWGMERAPTERAVDTLMANLRKKLEPRPKQPQYLLSQRGVGYRLQVPTSAGSLS
ncbi:winged helix-turn-helix domain-containing protein [Acanthopleuribacter pedis]|uniref:Response regulator transcription factor n=1 Tax=Acanthopleuribacter pedis TaxID=442870 RepID=A0A8J7QLZ3_9BACT|nr:response regulator transcription factor [Acanthopleuribacter pedis]